MIIIQIVILAIAIGAVYISSKPTTGVESLSVGSEKVKGIIVKVISILTLLSGFEVLNFPFFSVLLEALGFVSSNIDSVWNSVVEIISILVAGFQIFVKDNTDTVVAKYLEVARNKGPKGFAKGANSALDYAQKLAE